MTTCTNSSDAYLSIENKTSLINMEGEHNYRQRFQNMKLVLKELQEQLAIYKNRCAGVDTVALMLKESKLEVVKLTRQCKALETAVANLQNRLSTNGLSSSVNIEETELYVPGASKQTLDNLVRENARLRSQLKNSEGQTGKRSLEDHSLSRDVFDNLEAENKQLKAQLQESENLKISLSNQYKANVEKLKAENELQLQNLEKAFNEQLQKKPSYNKDENERKEIGCQTAEIPPSKIEELRETLKHISQQCLDLDNNLENIYLVKSCNSKENSQYKEKIGVSEEAYADLERRLNQVVMMNQRWQAHNDSQEQQVHLLGARIAELEDINQDMENIRAETDVLRIENQRLKYDVENLTRELNQRRIQPDMDHSLVEILKQQIQVCTEDFNTERKDREQAVNRAKALQDEVNRLKNERDLLKQEVEMFKTSKSPETPVDRRIPGYQPVPNFNRYKMRSVDHNVQRAPPHLSPASYWSSGPSTPSSSISPVTSPVPMSFSSNSMAGDRSSSYAPSSQDSAVGGLSTRGSAQRPALSHTDSNFHSMPRAIRSSTPDNTQISGISHQHDSGVSMPAVSRKSSSTSSSGKSKGDYLTCPKCNQEFSEKQEQDLLAHLEQCKA